MNSNQNTALILVSDEIAQDLDLGWLGIIPALANADTETIDAIIEFFRAKLRNKHTRRGYATAVREFLLFVGTRPSGQHLNSIRSIDVSDWVAAMEDSGVSIPTIKQRLAAARRFFNELMTAGRLDGNPAAIVKGPRYRIDIGKTPVLTTDEVRTLLDSINRETLVGMRDHTLIATMAYTFCRIEAALKLRAEDVVHQQRRLWLNLQEKGGKTHQIPCHRHLEVYLADYLERIEAKNRLNQPIFATVHREVNDDGTITYEPSKRAMTQGMAWAMLQRRAKAAGLTTHVTNHTFRATGITAFLRAGGLLERAALIANHASTRTTQLYDRRSREIAWAEIEKIDY